MGGSGRLPPADKASLGSRHRTKYRRAPSAARHLGLCWGRFDLRALASIGRAQYPAPRKNRQPVLVGFEQGLRQARRRSEARFRPGPEGWGRLV
jgi:hypothetical protein